MCETDYKKDYIVTWVGKSEVVEQQEGYTIEDLEKWYGKDSLDRINAIYECWNSDCVPGAERVIIMITKVFREIIFQK